LSQVRGGKEGRGRKRREEERRGEEGGRGRREEGTCAPSSRAIEAFTIFPSDGSDVHRLSQVRGGKEEEREEEGRGRGRGRGRREEGGRRREEGGGRREGTCAPSSGPVEAFTIFPSDRSDVHRLSQTAIKVPLRPVSIVDH
jgi:hypothetical protein